MNKDAVAEMSQQHQVETAHQQVPEGYKQTEVGVIPEDWKIEVLDDCTVKVGSGKTPTGGSSVYVDTGRPFIRSQNVERGSLDLSDVAYITDDIHSTFLGSELKENDVLLNITGASIGRCAKANKLISGGNVNQHVCIIRTVEEKLVPSLLVELINSRLGQEQIDSYQAGGNREGLNFKQVRQLKFPVAKSIREQFSIANALSDTDALLSELEKLIAKKQAIKTATMQQLLTGCTRLPQFAHHPDGSKKGYKQSELGEIPEDWEVEALGENCHTYSGGTPSTSNSSFYGGDIKWITSSDLNRSLIFEVRGRITELGLEKSAAKMIQPGTFLIALYGATAGVCAISKISAAINQAVLAVIPKNHSSKYLYYWFNKNKDEIIDTYTQGGQPNLSGNIIRSVKLPIPLADEQTAIATILSDMDEEIQALEQRLNKTRQIKQGMMQELLTGKIRLVKPINEESEHD